MKRNSFILYCSMFEVLDDLTLEERGHLITEIVNFVNGKETDFEKLPEKVAFVLKYFMFPSLQKDIDRYEKICKNTYLTRNKSILKNTENLSKNYKEFLKTDYWKLVRKMKLEKQNCCELCGSKTRLHIHHISYENHFKEHEHLEDLQVLCKTCHNKKHKKEEVEPPF